MPEITQSFADELTRVAQLQLQTSRNFKLPRMERIKEYEDMYMGIVPKQLRNPFNDDFGFASSFVDNLTSQLDEPPTIKFGYQDLADAKASQRVTAAFEIESQSALPNAQWRLKDRWATRLAIFSGRGIYRYYAESPLDPATSKPTYKSNFNVVDLFDFHFEPDGGGLLENHLFTGEEAVFKTKEELQQGAINGYYDPEQVGRLVASAGASDYKDVSNDVGQRNNRAKGLKVDPVTNNYTGQQVFKFVQWFMTYKGERWYLLFEDRTGTWVRIKPLKEIFPSGMWPYASWATHEDPRNFLSKSPFDIAYPIGKNINRFLNQELYNREKRNLGRELYDPDMITDIASLLNPSPDRKIPVDTKNGQRALSSAIFKSEDGELTGTLDFVNFLDSYGGRNAGSTPGSQGQTENNKKVGIYFGEMQAIKNRLSINNQSKRECFRDIGLRYVEGLDTCLTGELPIKLMGAKGVEWHKLTREDLKRNRPFDIIISGGSEEDQKNNALNLRKMQSLSIVMSVNPRWKDRQILKTAGFNEEDVKEAFSTDDGASIELFSEAARAVEDIVSNRKVELNRGANIAFMQKIIDLGEELADDIPLAKFNEIMDYATNHAEIAAGNEARKAAEMIKAKAMSAITPSPATAPSYPMPGGAKPPVMPSGIPANVPAPLPQ